MDDPKAKAFMFRERAEEVRNVAEMVKGEVARKILLRVVADYEELARQQETMLRAGESPARPAASSAAGRSAK